MSETSRCRDRLIKYCEGDGLDLGFGGDPIKPSAICIDLLEPYTKVGSAPQHLRGTARDLYWFRNNCLDYVFSSHLIEDFVYVEQIQILNEWLRVLRFGGYLVLYTVHQQRFLQHCNRTGQGTNDAHKEADYSLETFKEKVLSHISLIGRCHIVHENQQCEDYSWEVVLQKM